MNYNKDLITFIKELDFGFDLNGSYFYYLDGSKNYDTDIIYDLYICKKLFKQTIVDEDYYLIAKYNFYDIGFGLHLEISGIKSKDIWKVTDREDRFIKPIFFDTKEQLISKLENLILIG